MTRAELYGEIADGVVHRYSTIQIPTPLFSGTNSLNRLGEFNQGVFSGPRGKLASSH